MGPIYYQRTRRRKKNGNWSKWTGWRIVPQEEAPSQLTGFAWKVRLTGDVWQHEYQRAGREVF